MPEAEYTPPSSPCQEEPPALETVYFPSALKKDVTYRLTRIESTVRSLLKSGELSDYDDEMANDLREAVCYLRALVEANRWTPESFRQG